MVAICIIAPYGCCEDYNEGLERTTQCLMIMGLVKNTMINSDNGVQC